MRRVPGPEFKFDFTAHHVIVFLTRSYHVFSVGNCIGLSMGGNDVGKVEEGEQA